MSEPLQANTRFVFIDALRGLAALAVVVFHCYGGKLQGTLSKQMPWFLDLIFRHGFLGVAVFFAISGFVITHCLRNTRITLSYAARFTLRRQIRLDPAYWVTIAVAIAYLVCCYSVDSGRTGLIPRAGQVLAHLFYLQDILKVGNLVPVSWTLCIEVQFYLFLILAFWLGQALARGESGVRDATTCWAIVIPCCVVSLYGACTGHFRIHGTILSFWHLFVPGILAYWAIQRTVHPWIFWIVALSIVTTGIAVGDPTMPLSAVTGMLLFVIGVQGRLHRFLGHPVFQYLGRISYSLYLIHFEVAMRVINLGHRVAGDSPLLAVGFFILAIAASIVVAHVLWWAVEAPSMRWSKRIRLPATNDVPSSRKQPIAAPAKIATTSLATGPTL